MRLKLLTFFVLLSAGSAFAQRGQKQPPVFHEVSNQAVVQSVYPDAAKVDKVNEYWYRIVDASGKALGFAMTSSDYCKDVKGYSNTTPVMIITDKKFIIKKVALLSNYESAGYVRKLEGAGFFSSWNGKAVKAAQKAQVDGFTGATYTASAVRKNVEFLLENGAKKLPKK